MATVRDPLFHQPIPLRARQQAQTFAARHVRPDKVRQVYLNTLAVQAVADYLRYFGIPVDLATNDSWQPALQVLGNVADLCVRGWGRLECRPVLPSATTLDVPPEARGDRAGYIAVQFDRDLRSATLLGFLPSLEGEVIPLTDLHPLDELLIQLSQPRSVPAAATLARLSAWLQDKATAGWQQLEELALPPLTPALSFRSCSAPRTNGKGTLLRAQRAKVLQLSRAGDQVALALSIAPLGNGAVSQPLAAREFDISVDVCPLLPATHLPADLSVQILDAAEVVVMHASARGTPAVSLEFSGEAEEVFSVRLLLGDVAVTEAFAI